MRRATSTASSPSRPRTSSRTRSRRSSSSIAPSGSTRRRTPRRARLSCSPIRKRGRATPTRPARSAAPRRRSRTRSSTSRSRSTTLKKQLLDATTASEKAKQAVAQNSSALQKKLAEREQLLSQLDQAKMQEQMNKAMTQLSETVGDEVPTFEEVRNKIEKRLAKAQASTELTGTGVESQMLEVEQAQASAEAQARLSELRTELGLSTPPRRKGETKGTADQSVGESAAFEEVRNRSRSALRRPRPRRSSRVPASSHRCSRSSRPRRAWRHRRASRSCAPSSGSARLPRPRRKRGQGRDQGSHGRGLSVRRPVGADVRGR